MSWERWEKKVSTNNFKNTLRNKVTISILKGFFVIETQNKTKAVWKSVLQFYATEGFV